MAYKPPKQGKEYDGPPTHRLLPGEDTVRPKSVRKCKYCQAQIAWLVSAGGKFYPVNVSGELANSGNLIVRRNDFHNCRKKTE